MMWWVAEGETALGPYSDDQLKQFAREGRINPATYVRNDVSEWVEADRITGLFDGVLTINRETVPQQPTFAIQRSTQRQLQAAQSHRVQTIEKTGKQWKAMLVLSVIVAIAGIVVIARLPERTHGYGLAMIVGGIGSFFGTKICIWWFHG